jgi:hypothetical protein
MSVWQQKILKFTRMLTRSPSTFRFEIHNV